MDTEMNEWSDAGRLVERLQAEITEFQRRYGDRTPAAQPFDPNATRYPDPRDYSSALNDRVVVGLAVPFFTTIPAPRGHQRRFMPGAFSRAMRCNDIGLRINHADAGGDPLLASTRERTLRLWESELGLMCCFTPSTPSGDQVLRLAAAGKYGGLSIGYRPSTSKMSECEGIESIAEADVVELSLVPKHTRPAFAQTWVRVMSLKNCYQLERRAFATVLTTPRAAALSIAPGVAYRLPVIQANTLVDAGAATIIRRG